MLIFSADQLSKALKIVIVGIGLLCGHYAMAQPTYIDCTDCKPYCTEMYTNATCEKLPPGEGRCVCTVRP